MSETLKPAAETAGDLVSVIERIGEQLPEHIRTFVMFQLCELANRRLDSIVRNGTSRIVRETWVDRVVTPTIGEAIAEVVEEVRAAGDLWLRAAGRNGG